MKSHDVYQLEGELDRLATQSQLFKEYETPVYERVLGEYSQTRILDIGSNNGIKTVDRFGRPEVAKVLGVEFHEDLTRQAQGQYGNEVFSFHSCDVEGEDFYHQLLALMTEEGIEAFDVVHISLVLLHLHQPERVLDVARRVLAPQGQLLIVETADHLSRIVPDDEGLCQGFLKALSQNPYSGDRTFGRKLPELLEQCGFEGIGVENLVMTAGAENPEKKRMIYDTFCSYIKEDAQLLARESDPNCVACVQWVNDYHEAFTQQILGQGSELTMGLTTICCRAKPLRFVPMGEEHLDRVVALCDKLVGENLYPKSYLEDTLTDPTRFFSLLVSHDDEIAGYIHYFLMDVEEMERYAHISPGALNQLTHVERPLLGNLQSVAVSPAFRGHGISAQLVEHYLDTVAQQGANLAIGVFWKPKGAAPMDKTLRATGFQFWMDVYDVWAEKESLVCPHCDGACHCVGAIYYQVLSNKRGKERNDET